jgi:hypothetical protein
VLWLIVLGPALLARADSTAATQKPPAHNYAQDCAKPDNPRLEAGITHDAFEQQMKSLAAPGQPLSDDSDLRRAMCEVALYRLESSAGSLSPNLPRAAEPSTLQSAEGAFENRLAGLETDLRQMRASIGAGASTEKDHKQPCKIEIVAGIAALALVFSILSIFFANWTTRRALRNAGLL